MAFGYELLHGRHGAAGHCRKEEGKTIVHVRGLKPGETCVLYALVDAGAEKQDEQTADSSGQAVLAGMGETPVFVAAEGRLCLWQGGEENCLRASEWMKQAQPKTEKTQKDVSPKEKDDQEKQRMIRSEDPVKILSRDLEEIQLTPEPVNFIPAAEPEGKQPVSEAEPTYTLRSAGTGEPVDTLPD